MHCVRKEKIKRKQKNKTNKNTSPTVSQAQRPAVGRTLQPLLSQVITDALVFHKAHSSDDARDPTDLQVHHSFPLFESSDTVWVKKVAKGVLGPTYRGPQKVTLSVPTALKATGMTPWIHYTQESGRKWKPQMRTPSDPLRFHQAPGTSTPCPSISS